MENIMEVPQKTKFKVATRSNNPTPGHISGQNYNSKRYTHPYVHNGTIHNSQDMKITWIHVHKWMNKEDMIHMQWNIQFSSVAQSCLILCAPLTAARQASLLSSGPGACSNSCPSSQWYYPTISSSLVAFSSCLQFFLHQGLFQWVSSLHQVAKVLTFQLWHQSLQWIFRTDFLKDWLVGSPCSPRDSQETSTPQFKRINSSALSFLYGPTLPSIHDYWKNDSFD